MHTLFARGFRPFFLAAATFSGLAMFAWALIWFGLWAPDLGPVLPAAWHAHEMIYGYTVAVVAGFLLTAVSNWTGRDTLSGFGLAALAGVWLGARLALILGATVTAMALDLLFSLGLFLALAVPLYRAKQWRQAGVLAKVGLLGAGNAAFYSGASGAWPAGIPIALNGGLYLLVGLILTIAGRVLPGFIERGVPATQAVRNPAWITPVGMVLFLAFFVLDVFTTFDRAAGIVAALLAVVYAWRLLCWHVTGIWSRPLLWGLYLAHAALVLGLFAISLSAFDQLPRVLALHVLAIGGIGLATLAMMARVALGHTGRSIHEPPRGVAWMLGGLILAVLARVALALWHDGALYRLSVGLSQGLWIVVFALFVFIYFRILAGPRADGQSG